MFIGASEVAAALGVSPYKSRLALWAEKSGQQEVKEVRSALTDFGLAVEGLLLDRFERDYDTLLIRQPQIIDEALGIRATPDAECPLGVVEAKTSVRKDQWSNGVPIWYQVQVQTQMMIFGRDMAYLPVYFQDRDYEVFEVGADPEMFRLIRDGVAEFRYAVEHGVIPEAVFSDVSLLADLYPQSVGIPIELDSETATAVDAIKHLKSARKLIDLQIDELEAKIKAFMKESDSAFVGEKLVATWKTTESRILDQKAIKEQMPEIAERFTKVSSSRRFLVK